MVKPVKIVNSLAVIAWISLIIILLYRDYTGVSLGKVNALSGIIDRSVNWYAIYEGREKVGTARFEYEKVGNEIVIRDEREMTVRRVGKDLRVTERMKAVCDEHYMIKSFEYALPESGIKLTGKVDGETLIFFLESGEKRKAHQTSLRDGLVYLPITFVPALVQKKPAAGAVFEVPFLDFNSLSVAVIKVVVEEIRPIKSGTELPSLYKLRSGNFVWWSNELGRIVKEENPAGFALYAAEEQEARGRSDLLLVDYTSLPFFKSNVLLQHPEELKRLKVRIQGFQLDGAIYRDSLASMEKDILVLREADLADLREKTYTLPFSGQGMNRHLESDQWISSDYKPLQDTGRIYGRTSKNNPVALTEYLNGYLFNLIRTRPSFFVADGATILKSLAGDYLQRMIMFATYARAAGLPTRLVGGLVYRNGHFHFHTWPEVWLPRWIPVDPALYQFPADVTHIPLRTGSVLELASLVEDLKHLRMEVVEE